MPTSSSESIDIAAWLIEAGADSTPRGAFPKKTARDWAEQLGYDALAAQLPSRSR